MSKRRTKVEEWLDKETPHKKKALENASRYFDPKDSLTVNTLEAIYGQESSFGLNRRTRGIAGAAGDFQLEQETALRYGLKKGNVGSQPKMTGTFVSGNDNNESKAVAGPYRVFASKHVFRSSS